MTSILSMYIKEIPDMDLLDYSEELELSDMIKAGDQEALERMIEANLRIVISIAKKYLGRGLNFEDLIQEGNIGLIKAAKKYDPRRGTRFYTFAYWWVDQSIKRSLATKSRSIRVPNNVHNDMATGRTPEIGELSLEYGEDRTLSETIQFNEPEDMDDLSKYLINNVLEVLKPRERYILEHKFGMNNSPIKTLVSMGKDLDISCERVRQIYNEAMEKIKPSLTSLGMRAYV